MKKLIAVILCAFVSSGFTHAGAQSNVPEDYKLVDETQEIVSYDCQTGEETVTKETYKVYVPIEGARPEPFELFFPQVEPSDPIYPNFQYPK